MFHFIPEITSKHLGSYAAMDQFKLVLPKNTSLTCDSWFGVKSWLEYHVSLSITTAMSDNQGGGLWQLFGHQLKLNEYCSFTNGKIIITLFQDKTLVKTASTMFKIDKINAQLMTPFEALETNIQPPTIQLSESAVNLLSQLPKEDLMKLASALGKSSS